MQHTPPSSPPIVERALFVAFALVAVGLTHVAGAQESDAGSSFAEAIWAVAYVLALFAVLKKRELAKPLLAKSWPLLVAVGLALASTMWSSDQLLTLRRSIGLAGTMTIALYVVTRYPLATFLKTLVATVDAAAIFSAAMVFANPGLGVMQGAYQGAWRGIFIEKNHLGAAMMLGILTAIVLLPESTGRLRTFTYASIALCATLLVGSRSMTSIVALALAVGLRVALLRFGSDFRSIRRLAIVACVAASVIAFGAYAFDFTLGDALGLLGRDATFTGRDAVWQVAVRFIEQRLPLGYGYQVFWEPTSPSAAAFMSDLGWDPSTAHNGFLEAGLDLGLAGIAALLWFLMSGLARGAKMLVDRRRITAAWPFLVITSMIVSNFAEATFLLYNDLLWLTVVVAFFYATLDPASDSAPSASVSPRLVLEAA